MVVLLQFYKLSNRISILKLEALTQKYRLLLGFPWIKIGLFLTRELPVLNLDCAAATF